MSRADRFLRRCGVLLKQAGAVLERYWHRLFEKGDIPVSARPETATVFHSLPLDSPPELFKNETKTKTNPPIRIGGETAHAVVVFETASSARLYIGLIPPAEGITVLLRELGS